MRTPALIACTLLIATAILAGCTSNNAQQSTGNSTGDQSQISGNTTIYGNGNSSTNMTTNTTGNSTGNSSMMPGNSTLPH